MGIANALKVLARRSLKQVFYKRPAKVCSEPEQAAVTATLETVDLLSRKIKASIQRMVTARSLDTSGIAKRVLCAIEGYRRGGSDELQGVAKPVKRSQ